MGSGNGESLAGQKKREINKQTNITLTLSSTACYHTDVFVKDHNGVPIVGAVWPGTTVFPDFTSLNANLWWTKNLQELQNRIHFDGVWIDMNEPSNFVHGSTKGWPPIPFLITHCFAPA